ncbi:MAG: hypothetical protein DMD35_14560 [Gemmatimonadetes bacterium]|nr:MAG: hypothetical protein DMD35_14560 [Gemmatimonadota bacterium]
MSIPQVSDAASICETQNRPVLAIATPCGRPDSVSVELIVPVGWVNFWPSSGAVARELPQATEKRRTKTAVGLPRKTAERMLMAKSTVGAVNVDDRLIERQVRSSPQFRCVREITICSERYRKS